MKIFIFFISTLFLVFISKSSEGLDVNDIICPEVCLTCTSPTVCTSCIDNYFLFSGDCLQCSVDCKTTIDELPMFKM